jgi:ABC-type sugar transport system ATPase subunit
MRCSSLNVEQLEQLGGHSLMYGTVAGSDARATMHVAGQTSVRAGSAIGMSMDAAHAHLFAADDAGAAL